MKNLYNEIKNKLDKNTYFELDTNKQSFVRFPVNYINLTNDFISIEVGTIVYNNVKKHDAIINNINELYNAVSYYSEINDCYASVYVITKANSEIEDYRVCYYDDGENIENSVDFESVEKVIEFLNK